MSAIQLRYLKQMKRLKYKITSARILLFAGFITLWEVAATAGWIDDFIFSSPSRIIKTLFAMILPHCRYRSRNRYQFCTDCTARCRHCHFTLEQQNGICRIRTVSGASEQPAEIRPCAYDYRVARQ